MNTEEIVNYLTMYTDLKKTPATTLAKVIDEYDDPEELVYQAAGLLNEDFPYKKLLAEYKKGQFFWNSAEYQEHRALQKERDSMLANPPEVREGEIECPKCHSKKTLTIETQSRSADEGFTYYIHCLNPKCKAITR